MRTVYGIQNIKLMNCKYTTELKNLEKNNIDTNELINDKIKNLKNIIKIQMMIVNTVKTLFIFYLVSYDLQ
jgi:hypothetical protein